MTGNPKFPKAGEHGEIAELFPDVFFVTGTVDMKGPLPTRFSRNMTILRQDGELVLVNSVRLGEAGLAALDRLGKVTHVIRLAGFHGMDDPFYKERYDATVWSVDAPYVTGFDASKGKVYFTPDIIMHDDTELPVRDARLIRFASARPGEALLHLDREGGIVISGDCLQNWGSTDRYFSLPARLIMRLMGFIKPHNVGPGWLKAAKPDVKEIKALLDLQFQHVLPCHGAAVIGNARKLYEPVISNL